MRTQAEIDGILAQIRERLAARQQATGIALTIPPGGYVQEGDDWLSVIVAPNGNGMRAYEYVDALSQLERELRDKGLEKVVLVPVIAD